MNSNETDERDCTVFKDLYPVHCDCEDETREWIDGHMNACPKCKIWAEGWKDETPQGVDNASPTGKLSGEDRDIIKNVRMMFILGIGFIVVFSLWLSIWMFI